MQPNTVLAKQYLTLRSSDTCIGTFAHFTTHEEPTWPLRKLLEEDAGLDGEELDGAESFIRRCLQLTPEKRATATELLEDPWLSEA